MVNIIQLKYGIDMYKYTASWVKNGDGEKIIILYCWVMNIHVHLDIAVSYFKYATR